MVRENCTTVVEIPTNYFKVHSSICVPKNILELDCQVESFVRE